MTRGEAKEFGNMWLQINEDCKDSSTYVFFQMAIKALEQEPRKAHWVEHNTPSTTYYDCSLCGCVAPCTEFADSYLWKLSNFCPDCGADMRGEKDDNT